MQDSSSLNYITWNERKLKLYLHWIQNLLVLWCSPTFKVWAGMYKHMQIFLINASMSIWVTAFSHLGHWAPFPRWPHAFSSFGARHECGTPDQRTGTPLRCCPRPACPRPLATSCAAPPPAPQSQTPEMEMEMEMEDQFKRSRQKQG